MENIPAVLIELDYKGYFQRYALTPEEFQKEFAERLAGDMPAPVGADAETYTLRPMVHIWYCNATVGDDLWNTFFTDMEWGLSEGDISSDNLAYIEHSEMKSLAQYLPLKGFRPLLNNTPSSGYEIMDLSDAPEEIKAEILKNAESLEQRERNAASLDEMMKNAQEEQEEIQEHESNSPELDR